MRRASFNHRGILININQSLNHSSIECSLLIWFDPSTQKGVSIDYPTIAIHAISTAGDRLIPRPSVYLQLVDETPQVGIEVSNGDSGSISDDVERMVECRLVPDNEASCAFSSLHRLHSLNAKI